MSTTFPIASPTVRSLKARFAIAIAVVAGLVATTILGSSRASAATPQTATRPVILVAGFSPSALLDANRLEGQDCDLLFGEVHRQLGQLRIPYRDYGFYPNDTRCEGVSSPATTSATSLTTLARRFAFWVNATYPTQRVDVIAVSMGGVVVRKALERVQARDASFPARLSIEDTVTVGSPHAGASLGLMAICRMVNQQCAEMTPGSAWLSSLGHNPQGSSGSEWSLIGHPEDLVVTWPSSITMDRVSTARPPVFRTTMPGIIHASIWLPTVATQAIAAATFTGM